jgi:uncharacterized membrane protein
MPLTALALVLTAAVLHAVWNLAAKRATAHGAGSAPFALLSSGLMALLWLPAGLWWGVHEIPRWGTWQWAAVGASAVVHLAYYRCLLAGYRAADLTVVYPLARGSGPLLTATAAVLLLGETLTPGGLAGILGVCFGVFLIAGGPGLWRRAADPEQRARLHTGLRWGLLTGALIACYSVIDGVAIQKLAMAPLVFDWMNNLLRTGLQLPAYWRDPAVHRNAWRLQWRQGVVVAVLGPASYIAVLTALQLAPLSHVAPARECSLLVAALLGGRLLGEADRGLRLLGAACIALGVMALALA